MSSIYSWKFVCFGVFGGVTSFDDGGVQKHFMRIDFWGGKLSLPVTSDNLSAMSAKPVGADVKASGSLIMSGGSPRVELTSLLFDGDDGFRAPTAEQVQNGLVWRGQGTVVEKHEFPRRDGSQGYSLKVQSLGGTMDLRCTREAFEAASVGLASLTGSLSSEVVFMSGGTSRGLGVRHGVTVLSVSGGGSFDSSSESSEGDSLGLRRRRAA